MFGWYVEGGVMLEDEPSSGSMQYLAPSLNLIGFMTVDAGCGRVVNLACCMVPGKRQRDETR